MKPETTKPFKQRLSETKWEAILVENDGLSIGRMMSWILLVQLMYMWYQGMDVPDTLFHVFVILLSYNFGKKVTHPISLLLENKITPKILKEEPRENPKI